MNNDNEKQTREKKSALLWWNIQSVSSRLEILKKNGEHKLPFNVSDEVILKIYKNKL